MKNFSSLKDSALKTLENKWGQFVAITLVAYVICSGIGFVPYVGTLLTLAVIPLGYGYSIAILKNYRGGEIQLVDIFDAYKNTEVLGRVLLTLLLRGVYTFLWFLLLIVPGFIKSISYTMTEFVLNDNPDLKYDAAITRSSELMNGHKWEFFLFSLSFIGWFLLSILTFGIGFLWSTPYYMSAKSAYYHGLLEDEANKKPYGQDDYVKVLPTE